MAQLRGRTAIALLFSAGWAVFWSWWTFRDCQASCIAGLEPNQWGDWASGLASPLAFWWLVMGYLQQGDELQQNTKMLEQQASELQAQVSELRNQSAQLQASVEAQRSLVEVTREQLRLSTAASRTQMISAIAQQQPHFQFYSLEGAHRDSGADFQIKFINSGGAAYNVSFGLMVGTRVRLTGNYYRRRLSRDEMLEFGAVLPAIDPDQAPLAEEAEIHYVDAFGLDQSQPVRISWQGGSLKFEFPRGELRLLG